MTKLLLWVLFLNGFVWFFAWWGVWPLMVVGLIQVLAAHVALVREETK